MIMHKKKIVSFSLWGEKKQYLDGAVENIRQYKKIFPDWQCRFYVAAEVPAEYVHELIQENAEIVNRKESFGFLGLYWRFLPMADESIERFIVRDTDSKPTQRERNAVDEWEQSGRPAHIIRDAPVHNVPMLGGTWGAVPGCVKNFKNKLSAWFSNGIEACPENPRGEFFGTDQYFLAKYVWPEICYNHVAHIRKGCPGLRFTNADIELPELTDGHYVGMVA